MPGVQPDYDREIQDLLHWIDRELVQAFDITNAPSPNPDESFVPISEVERYFQENRYYRTGRLLRAVFGSQGLPVYPRDVAETCCRSFCILARLGKTQYIAAFAQDRNLYDNRLPFNPGAPPPNFPVDTNDPSFFQKFYEEQWKFCAPELKERSAVRFEERYILPFVALEKKEGGHTSTVYRAVVHEKHDELRPDSSTNHCYAIKTYKRRTAQRDYERESAAFKRITEAGIRSITPGIIGFHGSFEYRGSFNIILEYAEGGTLEHFFLRQDRPVLGDDIIALWQSLFEIIKGIFWIHDQQLPPDGVSQGVSVQGWHQDLKPANILVVVGEDPSAFRGISFKVADMGLSHFKTIMDGDAEAMDLDSHGTRTYGAPECYGLSSFTERRRNPVKRSVDIWSLGCIYSEAAIWIVYGLEGLREYRQKRSEATSRFTNFRGGDCFHNGQIRLGVVDHQHRSLKPDLSHEDFMTGWVLDTMVEEMLGHKPGSRPTAEQLDDRAERAVTRAKSLLEESKASNRSPPNLDYSPTSRHALTHRANGQHRRDTSQRENVLDENDRFFSTPHGSIHQQDSGFLQNLVLSGSPRAKGQVYGLGRAQVETSRAPPVQPSFGRPLDHEAQTPAPSGRFRTISNTVSHVPLSESPGPVSPGSPASVVHAEPQSPLRRPESEPTPTGGGMVASPVQSPKPVPARPEMPRCSLAEAWEWHKRRKYGDKKARLPFHELMGELEDRDHVFMIDDSHTMKKHWNEVQELAKLLVYIVKATDPDGIDLYFLSSNKRHNFKKASNVYATVRDHTPSAFTNLNSRLNDDLLAYAREIEPRGKFLGVLPFKTPRKRNIYVLTDGVLHAGEPTQGQDAIKMIVEKIRRAGMMRGQVGIQLISFGDDQNGIRRLQKLDCLNQELDLGLDVVDTEPSSGNVWKMLLGSIMESFDDDTITPFPSTSSAGVLEHRHS